MAVTTATPAQHGFRSISSPAVHGGDSAALGCETTGVGASSRPEGEGVGRRAAQVELDPSREEQRLQ